MIYLSFSFLEFLALESEKEKKIRSSFFNLFRSFLGSKRTKEKESQERKKEKEEEKSQKHRKKKKEGHTGSCGKSKTVCETLLQSFEASGVSV